MTSKLTIVIPAYNESASLPKVIPDLLSTCEKEDWQIIIVNDGSTDDTKNLLIEWELNPRIRVIHHKVNKGYGGAIKTGIENTITEFCITYDADGQHHTESVKFLLQCMVDSNADLIVGARPQKYSSGKLRETGKWIIRKLAKILLPLNINDLNSGMKIYQTELAKKYLPLCPNSMAYSDIITLIFISQKHLVLEKPIQVNARIAGESTIGVSTAMQTIIEIINILMLFNPLKIFIPTALLFFAITTFWQIPIFLKGNGLSVGALLGYVFSFVIFLLGLIAEQLGLIRKLILHRNG